MVHTVGGGTRGQTFFCKYCGRHWSLRWISTDELKASSVQQGLAEQHVATIALGRGDWKRKSWQPQLLDGESYYYARTLAKQLIAHDPYEFSIWPE